MKKLLAAAFGLFLVSQTIHAQILNPVKWSWEAVPAKEGEYILKLKATIDKGWHTYSQNVAPDGPIPTTLTFEKNADVELVGKTSERATVVHDEFDKMFDMQLKSLEGEAVFEQKVKVKKDTKLKGMVEFMVCDDSRCLPPDTREFEFDLKAGKTTGAVEPTPQMENSTVTAISIDTVAGIDTATAVVAVPITSKPEKFEKPLSDCGGDGATEAGSMGLLTILLLGFGGGLVALITPCVFPMIPLTVSFFTKRHKDKAKGKAEAIFYGFSIVFIYFLLAVPFLIWNITPDTLNDISTGAPLNIFFFLIFVIFAFSFFGFYEIQLPSSLANKVDSASNVGGLIGIFFMALTLAIVSFSCTGPILGSLLVGALASPGGKLNLVAGMTSFGLALALPFALFALFPGWLKSLPKSGGWLNSVKVVLGFVELIFAFKFLSNADLVKHWGLLKREVFLGIWALLGAGTFLYLVGKIKFPHDSVLHKLSPVRIGFAVVALAFTVYSAYGIPGNDLHLFSGFPPPKFYSLQKHESECPHNLNCFHNEYEAALEYAKKENKPLLLDFTGWACVNCRKMEENVWIDPEIYKRLNEDYVLVSLYVDDKEELPVEQQTVSEFFHGKKIKTIGNKFSEMEAKYFNNNTQPLYVLITPDEQLLTAPRGYTPDISEYKSYLDCGLNTYRTLQD